MVHSEEVSFKMLVRINTCAQQSSAKNGIFVAWILNSIDFYDSLAETESIFGSKCAFVLIADGDSFFIATDFTCARHTSEAKEFSFNHVAVVIHTQDVLSCVPAVCSFAHFSLHLLAKC